LEGRRKQQSSDYKVSAFLQPFAARKNVVADGEVSEVSFEVPIERSSWVVMRVLGSSHINSVWVVVDGKEVRTSKRSAQWCLDSVDQCWSQKERFIAEPNWLIPGPHSPTQERNIASGLRNLRWRQNEAQLRVGRAV